MAARPRLHPQPALPPAPGSLASSSAPTNGAVPAGSLSEPHALPAGPGDRDRPTAEQFAPPTTGEIAGENIVRPDDDTAPLPVILAQRSSAHAARPGARPNGASGDRPGGAAQSAGAAPDSGRMRGPFEPADHPAQPPTIARAGDADPGPTSRGPDASTPSKAATAESPAAAKLEEIKDLYLTAEAIGEDALARHFQQVSQRQRQLIKEYFDQAVNGDADGQSP